MILLCSTGGAELFKQFVLQVMCYPDGYIISDVPWGRGRVRPDCFDCHKGEEALVVYVDYYEDEATGEPRTEYLPLRKAKVVKARPYAGMLLLDLCMGDFVFYSPEVIREYAAGRRNLAGTLPQAKQRWSQLIGEQRDIVRAVPKVPGTPMQFATPSWTSGKYFVVRLQETAGEPPLHFLTKKESVDVRQRHEDWKSVVDRIAGTRQMKDKLFYEIHLEKASTKRRALATKGRGLATTFGGQTVFQLASGDCAELVVHFYFGEDVDRRSVPQTLLEVATDPTYVSTVGNTLIQVYPDQASGKIETLQLVVKPQLSKEFTRVRIQQRTADPAKASDLATIELYLQIVPRGVYIWMIVVLFFAGSFLNALPDDLGGPAFKIGWGAKLLGSAMMAGAFWIGFSKLPSKGG